MTERNRQPLSSREHPYRDILVSRGSRANKGSSVKYHYHQPDPVGTFRRHVLLLRIASADLTPLCAHRFAGANAFAASSAFKRV